MVFKQIDEREFAMLAAARKYKHTKVMSMLDEFMLSTDVKVVEMDWKGEYKNADACASTWRRGIEKAKLGCSIMKRGDRLFLIKNEI